MNKQYQTTRGVVSLLPMQGELDRLNALREHPRFKIPVPTYSKTTALGIVETFQHDETTLDVPGDEKQTEANRAAWTEWKAKQVVADMEYRTAFVKSVIANGIAPDEKAVETWMAKRKFTGEPVPDDPNERHFEWVMSEIIGTPDDFNHIVVEIMRASELPEEMIRVAEESFCGRVERRDEVARPAPIRNAGMAIQPALRASAGGNTDGHKSKRVRRAK